MPSTNGHGLKRAVLWAILYARVSTDEQARSGYSLAQQLEALREYAAREGYEVLQEVSDPGQSGASLERPGMDHVRDLVTAGGVSVVLAQDRDRFAREPAYHYLLRREFEEHGTKIRALNDRGDDTPEGELTDGVLDQLAKYERAKIAERSRRGKLQKAREGKVMAGHRVKYGFKLNATRDGLLVDEDKMLNVRRIFRMVGTEGHSLNAVYRTFERERIPTPGGGKRWDRAFFRVAILDDVYKPHTYEEVEELVSPEVAARLERGRLYGIWWYNRLRVRTRQVSEPSENGRRYRREARFTVKPKEEWVAVPVPYSGIPREVVDAAQAAIKDNRRPSKAGRRFWELSGGVLRCAECDHTTTYHSVRAHSGTHYHHYYYCRLHHKYGDAECTHRKNHRAPDTEGRVWDLVSGLLKDPERLRVGLDEMIEAERAGVRGDPEAEALAWLDKITALDDKRSRYQDMAAEGHITFDELGAKLGELEGQRTTAEEELDSLELRRARLEDLERDKETLLKEYTGMVPEELDELTGEDRHQVYRMLRLQVFVFPNGDLEVRGVLREAVCTPMDTRSVYPRRNRGLFQSVRRQGGLISEYYLGEAPLAWRFPARNRIIAGLAGTVVVVEAPEHSGALITARHALDAGRDVWAVPGPPGVRECRGSNGLLADGAGVLWDIPEFVDAVAREHRVPVAGEASGDVEPLPEGLDNTEAAVLSGVGFVPRGVDVVANESGVEMPEVLTALALLELKGFVSRDGVGSYVRRAVL